MLRDPQIQCLFFFEFNEKIKRLLCIVSNKYRRAQQSKNTLVLKNEFNLTEDQLHVDKVFLLPHIVCSESYVKAFQYKVLKGATSQYFELF